MDRLQQHELLFGATLFGASCTHRTSIDDAKAYGFSSRLIRAVGRMVVSWLLVATVIYGIYSLVELGDAHQQRVVQRQVAEDLRLVLQQGDLSRVSRLLKQLGSNMTNRELKGWRDLIIRSEATLYRLLDAEPMRRKRIEQYLDNMKNTTQTKDLLIAQAMLASESERIVFISQLEKWDGSGNRDPDVPYLLATAYAAQRKHKRAQAAYRRAHDLGPEHLAHFASQVEYLLSKKRKRKVRKLVGVMNAIDHRSWWTRLCEAQLGQAANEVLSPSTPAVVVGKWRLQQARQAHRRDQPKLVEKRLKQAMRQVSRQAPFLLDFYQQLIACGQREIATRLLSLDEWPEQHRPTKQIAQRWNQLGTKPKRKRQMHLSR